MNRTEVATVLAAASTIDPTVPQPSADVLAMWVAMLDDVPVDAGTHAVRAYYRSASYREHRRTITPGDIVGHWKDQRQEASERQVVEDVRAQRAAIEAAPSELPTLRELYARFDARRRGGDPDEAEAEAAAARAVLDVECPHCKARPRNRCTTPQGRELVKMPAHPGRYDALSELLHVK